MMSLACIELLCAFGKFASEQTEQWRLDHAELMDAYEVASAELKDGIGGDTK